MDTNDKSSTGQTFEAGTEVHLTIAATVAKSGGYTINDDRGNLWGQCPRGMSFLVKVERAPVELPTKFGAVVRATVGKRRQVLVLADPAQARSGGLRGSWPSVWFSPAQSIWCRGEDLTDVEVLSQGIDEPAEATQ